MKNIVDCNTGLQEDPNRIICWGLKTPILRVARLRQSLVIAGNWRISGAGSCSEEAAKLDIEDTLGHISE